ncbi:AAA family ATPase [Priestia megaterium]|nr:AAA family ATPase [Priestia megaterium]
MYFESLRVEDKMFIRKLEIGSFRGLNDLELTFLKPEHNYFKKLSLSILVGENGTGKSSIFQLLTSLFSPTQFKSNMQPDCKLEYEINGQYILYDSNEMYPINYPAKMIVSSFSAFDPYDQWSYVPFKPKLEKALERNKVEDMTKYIHLGPSNRGYSSFDNVILAITKSLFIRSEDKKKLKCYHDLLNIIKFRRAKGLIINHERLREIPRLIETLATKFQGMDRAIRIYKEIYEKTLELRRESNVHFPNYRRFRPRGFAIAVEQFSFELSELYSEYVNLDFIGPMIKDVIFENENGDEVLLSEMSSGEITMLYRFLPLVMEIEDNNIILIDEPETHLHPRWTRKFIPYLTSLFSEYDVHVLIATHSPAIASDVPMKCIVGLRKQEGRVHQYTPRDRTLGGHSNDMLQDVFELKELSSINGQKSIEQIIEILEQSPTSKQIKEAQQIYKDLSTTSEKYRLYQKYKRFLGE